MAAPLPARTVVSTQNTVRPRDAAILQMKNGNRKVSVTYGKSGVPTEPATNDNPRPRDAAIRQAANDNRNTSVVYKNPNSITKGNYGPTTVSEDFNQTYNQAGLQPSVGGVASYRNTQVDRGPATQEYSQAPSNDNGGAQGDRVSKVGRAKEAFKRRGSVATPAQVKTKFQHPKKALLKALPGGDGLAGDLINRALVTETSLIIISAAGFAWITFQLPLAIISLGAFAIASALDAIKESFESNVVGEAISWVGSVAYDAFNSLSDTVWGVDLDTFSPTTLFMLTDGVVMIIGWLTLLIIGFVYLLEGVPCVFGEKGSGLKIAALLLAMIGYALPLLNLFPWFIVWVIAVWIYPE